MLIAIAGCFGAWRDLEEAMTGRQGTIGLSTRGEP